MKSTGNVNNRIKRLSGILLAVMLVLFAALSVSPDAYAAGDILARLPVRQQIVAENANDDVTFTYTLTALTPGAPLPEGASGGSYVFTIGGTALLMNHSVSITFPDAGGSGSQDMYVYTYSLKCTGCDNTDYKTDDKEYTIKVYVCKDNDGNHVAHVMVHNPDGTKNSDGAEFIHSKKGPDGVDPIIIVDPPVRKIIDGDPAEDDEFVFRLRAQESGNPMPEGSVNGEKYMSVFGSGIEEFGEWTYTEPGTYNYDISEVNTGNPNYTYDTTMYTLTDVVTLNGNEFNVQRTIVDSFGNIVQNTLVTPRSGDGDTVNLEFTNVYNNFNTTPSPTVTPTGEPTDTPTETPTDTPTVTPTETPTETPTVTPPTTPTVTPTVTPPTTPTIRPTITPTVPTSSPKVPTSSPGKGTVYTGDPNNSMLYVIIIALSVAAIVCLLIYKRKTDES